MPQPNKRKKQKQVADGVPVQDIDAMSKRRKTSKLLEESLKVPKAESSPIDAIVVPDAIPSLHGKKRTPQAEAATNTNTALVLPDVATSLPPPMNPAIAEAATNTASPDVVASASLPPDDSDVVDDEDNAKNDSFTDTRSKNHPKATDPSTSTSTQGSKLERVIKTETLPAPPNDLSTNTSTQGIKLEPVDKTETAHAPVYANTSTSAREIKREPVVFKTETAPAPVPVNPSIDQAEAEAKALIHIPTEPTVITNGPHLNRTVTVHRKVAKRTDFLHPAPPPQHIAVPLPPSPQADNIPVTQEPRVEEPLPTTIHEAASKIAEPGISEGLPSPKSTPRSAAAIDTSSRRRSRRQAQLPLIETSETQPKDTDDANADDDDPEADADCVDDDGDLSGSAPPPTATVNALIHRRSSRRVISASSTGVPISPRTAAVRASTRRRSRRQTQLPPIETNEAQQTDTDDDDNNVDDDGDLPGPAPPTTTVVNALVRRRSSRRVISTSDTGTATATPVLPPCTAAVEVTSRGQSQRQTEILSIEMREAHLEDDYDAHLGDLVGPSWERRLNELADYRKIHGHCNVSSRDSENVKLGKWVSTQRTRYRFYLEGKTSPMTALRIQALESLGFEWTRVVDGAGIWKDRLSELADYRKIHGHCNVPKVYSENAQLGTWVSTQRKNYRFHLEGKTSPMTALRIQALESLGFEWDRFGPSWGARMSELADYRKIHGHCNVPSRCSENIQLGHWVARQRANYKLHREGKSLMTPLRIQALESLGFWLSF
jgi:hypothetical protein